MFSKNSKLSEAMKRYKITINIERIIDSESEIREIFLNKCHNCHKFGHKSMNCRLKCYTCGKASTYDLTKAYCRECKLHNRSCIWTINYIHSNYGKMSALILPGDNEAILQIARSVYIPKKESSTKYRNPILSQNPDFTRSGRSRQPRQFKQQKGNGHRRNISYDVIFSEEFDSEKAFNGGSYISQVSNYSKKVFQESYFDILKQEIAKTMESKDKPVDKPNHPLVNNTKTPQKRYQKSYKTVSHKEKYFQAKNSVKGSCRYGYNCNRKNCTFSHPNGRRINSKKSYHRQENKPQKELSRETRTTNKSYQKVYQEKNPILRLRKKYKQQKEGDTYVKTKMFG